MTQTLALNSLYNFKPNVAVYGSVLLKGISGDEEEARREIELLRSLEHPNVIKLCYAKAVGCGWVLATDWCVTGDLYSALYESSLPHGIILQYVVEVARGIKYLHQRNIMHGDVKPENVVIGNDGVAKLIDFGLARQFESKDEKVVTQGGTLLYAAPEVLLRKPHGVETDWWSLACVLHETIYGCFPWGISDLDVGDDEEEICRRICYEPLDKAGAMDNVQVGKELQNIVPELFEVLQQFFEKDPKARRIEVATMHLDSLELDLQQRLGHISKTEP
mmetsp:Transcript_9502/g.16645  ORF Transcript_9502/g.16645 Transcript_9502/m.16645 type:complete len:276 (+) Transcript_9502:236-1063(+)|eukprot:CAMPEP_0184511350 /NCGR_PEP_ID=MMETSP0198_2-20121128/2303_1 /TAXON_ID=1112570 /ORGANISM="Thraustochytrium sp., Strain LLF1b" /LENGTH=275 /DNA_ID=CAMNT_0026901307 /DNA_START=70 /DNA_END=897 /DNA_ORIENTATION=-